MPTAFAVLSVASLIFAASHAWFWQRAHDTAWIAAPLLLILLWLLLRRSRAAWWLFFSFAAIGLVSDIVRVSRHAVGAAWIAGGSSA